MGGYPDTADLVEAVQGFLASIEASLVGREAFHAKVAANVLGIVVRELRQQPDIAETAALGRLLIDDDRPLGMLRSEVCARLRDGRFAPDTPGLVDTLFAATLTRLAVDNPRYSTYRRLTGKG